MSHWFHRNPLKATNLVAFDLRGVIASLESSKICSDIRLTRGRLLELLTDPNNQLNEIDQESAKYFGLLYGFVFPLDGESGESKLRRLLTYKWTDSVLGGKATEAGDSWYEALSMTSNVALWYMKHAARIAGKDDVSDDEAKEVHMCLRKAAGLFQFVAAKTGVIGGERDPGSDLDPRVLGAYINQCTAEAQEVTVARAIELKHNASLISALSYETANLFFKADSSLSGLDEALFTKWRKYLQLKHKFYMAYAYSYCAEKLLAEDACGEAISSAREGLKCRKAALCYEAADGFCKEYVSAKGPGTSAKPDRHLFFRRLKPQLDRTLEKCERENGFIYHQKVPNDAPSLELKATYGLVKPELYEFPPSNELWSPSSYTSAFNISKAAMPNFSNPKQSEKDLPPVKEKPVYQTENDPKNSSGCTIS